MKKPSYFPIRKVIQDKELSFFDKLFYIVYCAVLFVALVLIVRTFWLYKELSLGGLAILIILFLFSNNFYKKYTVKYRGQYIQYIKERSGTEMAAVEEERSHYLQEIPSLYLKTVIKAAIASSVGGLAGLVLIFVTIFVLGPIIGIKSPILFISIIILEFFLILYIVVYRIIWKKFYKQFHVQNMAYLKRLKLSFRVWAVAISIMAIIFAIVFYRLLHKN